MSRFLLRHNVLIAYISVLRNIILILCSLVLFVGCSHSKNENTTQANLTRVESGGNKEATPIVEEKDSAYYYDMLEKGYYTICQEEDTTCMIKDVEDEDGTYKKLHVRLVVMESVKEEKININNFTDKDSVVSIKEPVALVTCEYENPRYNETIVIDRESMRNNFIFYSSHKKIEETNELFFEHFTFVMPVIVDVRKEVSIDLDFAFGIPHTKRIFGSSIIVQPAGYWSITNNMVNTLYGE